MQAIVHGFWRLEPCRAVNGELAATGRRASCALAFVDVGGDDDGVEDSERPSAARGG